MNGFIDFPPGMEEEETLSFSEDWRQIIHQDVFWIDAGGNRLLLDEMETSHCANVRKWIFLNLSRIAERALMLMALGPGPSGDVASDAFEAEMVELEHIVQNAPAWAAETPLVKALERRSQGRRAQEEENTVTAGRRTYSRKPKDVLAVHYDGTNLAEIQKFVNSPHLRVEEEMISGPRPLRGVQKVVSVWGVNSATVVPVGSWLLTDENGETFSSLTDEQFTADYKEKF